MFLSCIDTGERFQRCATSLLVLTDKFKIYSAQSVDLRLGGIVPVDSEFNWDSDVNNCVSSWVEEYSKKSNCFFQGSISFILSDSIWADTLDIYEVFDITKAEILLKSIKKTLYRMKYCVMDDNQFKKLKERAIECGIQVHIKESNPDDETTIESEGNLEFPKTEEIENNLSPDLEVSNSSNQVPTETETDWEQKIESNNNDIETVPENVCTYEKETDDGKDTDDKTEAGVTLDRWETLDDKVEEINLAIFVNPSKLYAQKLSHMDRYALV